MSNASVKNRAAQAQRPALAWMTWRAAVWLTLAVLAARVAYLILLCPYELLGDEALYWEQSRRLDLCYYEKGPVIPYLIAGSTTLFGSREWAVRLPAAVLSALAGLALARLATACSDGDQRVGFLAAVLFVLMPAYQGNAQICTVDAALVAAWIVGCWAGWHLFDVLERRESATAEWLLVGVALGFGTLCKQSMLLLPPGLLLYALLRRREIRWNVALARNASLAAVAFLLVLSPMLIWNHRNDWPTLAHTLGHLGAPGGDRTDVAPYNPLWTASLIAGQIIAFGPPAMVLMVYAIVRTFRDRHRQAALWPGRLLMLCCAAPSLTLYLAVTFRKPAEANWPMPAFATLLVLVAQLAVVELPRHARLVRDWLADPRRPRPRRGLLRRRPETLFRVAWDWTVIYGIAGWLVLSFAPLALRHTDLPIQARFSGHRARAQRVHELRQQVKADTGQEPLLIASQYMAAAQLAFYLPDHPVVYNAASQLGGRKSSWDYWPDTDLYDPSLSGRPAILLGREPGRWHAGLEFDPACAASVAAGRSIEPLDETLPAWLGRNYRGPRAAASGGL